MATNPLIQLGTVNRIRGSVVVLSYQALNVTASYLGKRGIRVDWAGEVTQMLETMTGVVPSPEPYLMGDITIAVLKTNGLAAAWFNQMLTQSYLGVVTVYPDTSQFGPFTFQQASIRRVAPESYAGDEPEAPFVVSGYVPINSTFWNLS